MCVQRWAGGVGGFMPSIAASSFPESWESPSFRNAEDLRGLLKHIWNSAELLTVHTWRNPSPTSTLSHSRLILYVGILMFPDVNSSFLGCYSPSQAARSWSRILMIIPYLAWHSELYKEPLWTELTPSVYQNLPIKTEIEGKKKTQIESSLRGPPKFRSLLRPPRLV